MRMILAFPCSTVFYFWWWKPCKFHQYPQPPGFEQFVDKEKSLIVTGTTTSPQLRLLFNSKRVFVNISVPCARDLLQKVKLTFHCLQDEHLIYQQVLLVTGLSCRALILALVPLLFCHLKADSPLIFPEQFGDHFGVK